MKKQINKKTSVPTLEPIEKVPVKQVVTVVETKTQKASAGHSCMLQQTEMAHQQQLKNMREMQENQYQMLQFVINDLQKEKKPVQSQIQQ